MGFNVRDKLLLLYLSHVVNLADTETTELEFHHSRSSNSSYMAEMELPPQLSFRIKIDIWDSLVSAQVPNHNAMHKLSYHTTHCGQRKEDPMAPSQK